MSNGDETMTRTDSVVIQSRRNYSFIHKNQDGFDIVEEREHQFTIPAQPGSCYWAILRIGYENHDQRILINDYIDMVASLMEERDSEKWEKFRTKAKIKTIKNDEILEKDANNWRDRIETNIKTMTRHGGCNPYGNRLRERGHILRWETDDSGASGWYILRTSTNEPFKRVRKTQTKGKDIIIRI